MKQNCLLLFSGGQDSTFLCLKVLIKKSFYEKNLTTIQHESQLESFLLLSHSLRYSVVFQTSTNIAFLNCYLQTYKNPLNHLQKNEAHLRLFRYQATTRISCFCNFCNQTTGHTKTDYTETMFLNLLRGAGLQGLTINFFSKRFVYQSYHCFLKNVFFFNTFQRKCKKSKTWYKQQKVKIKITCACLHFTPLYRPAITYTRSNLSLFQKKTKCPLFFDKTNYSLNFQRNKLRRHLISYIKFYFNRNFEVLFFKTSKLASTTAFLDIQTFTLLKTEGFSYCTKNFFLVDLQLLQSFPSSFLRKVSLLAFQKKAENSLSLQSVEDIEAFFFTTNFQGFLFLFARKTVFLRTKNFLLFFS